MIWQIAIGFTAGTIVRASEALGLTASAVSRGVSRLEARIGARLLNRTTRSLTLTDEGRRFYERVGPHLDGIEEAAIEAAGSTNVVRGRLRINVEPFFSRIVLASHVVTFLQQHPDVSLELIMRDARPSRRPCCGRIRPRLAVWRAAVRLVRRPQVG